MKKIIMIVIMALCISKAFCINVCSNGSFEVQGSGGQADAQDWIESSEAVQRTNSAARTGSWSMSITGGIEEWANAKQYFPQDLAGKQVVFSGYVMSPSANPAVAWHPDWFADNSVIVKVEQPDPSTTPIGGEEYYINDTTGPYDTWVYFAITNAPFPAAMANCKSVLLATMSGGIVYFDDVEVNVVTGSFPSTSGFAPPGTTGSQDGGAPGFVFRSPEYKTANITGPIPSSDWWTHLLVDDNTYTMSAYPIIYGNALNAFPAEGDDFGISMDYEGIGEMFSDWKVGTSVIPAILIRNDQMAKATTETRLDGYGDWHIKLETADGGGHKMNSTLAAGSPMAHYEFENGNPYLRLYSFGFPDSVDFYDLSGSEILNNITSSYTGDAIVFKLENPQNHNITWWGAYSETNTLWSREMNYLTANIGGGQNYLTVAALPSQSEANLVYQHAYTKIIDTRSEFSFNESNSIVTTTFTFTNEVLRSGFSTNVLTTMFPHHYKHLLSGTPRTEYYETMRGKLKLFTGNIFSTVLTNHGILTQFNEPTSSVGYSHATAVQGLHDEQYVKETFNVDTYATGKTLTRLAQSISIADKIGETALRDEFVTNLYNELADWFTYSPGQEPTFWADGGPYKFFTYFPPDYPSAGADWGRLVGWRAGFGTQALNDGNFHYGYWIYAASILSLYHPTFIEDYGWAIEEMIGHIAEADRNSTKYPYLRYFNPYTGRSYASGWYWDDNYQGNDLESTSECMNAWQAIFQWGQLTGNKTYRDLGLYLFWTEYSAVNEYWLDVDDENLHPGYNHTHANILRENAYEWNTHWGNAEQEWMYGIQMLPITPATLYRGLNQSYANRTWTELGGSFDEWHNIMAKFWGLIDPQSAINWFNTQTNIFTDESVSNDPRTLDQETWSITYHFLHNMNQLGHPSTDWYADKPSYGVFKDGFDYTLVGFNPSNSPISISFYNGSNALMHTMMELQPYETRYETIPVPETSNVLIYIISVIYSLKKYVSHFSNGN